MGFAEHLEHFFPDSDHAVFRPVRAEVEDRLPGFHVLRVAPDEPGQPWIFATCGAAQAAAEGEPGAEYVLLSPAHDAAIVEMLAALATVNADAPAGLGVGSLIRIGQPWIAQSWARQLLVLPPYPLGPGFETFEEDGRRTVVLWLVPVLTAEAQYVRTNGYEAFEQLIARNEVNVADPARRSVV